MHLSIRDLYTTILAGIIAFICYARINDMDLPLISSSYRIPIFMVGILGIIICTQAGGGNPSAMNAPIMKLLGAVGIGAALLILYGLITGAKMAFVGLVVVILSMWAISTLRHAIG